MSNNFLGILNKMLDWLKHVLVRFKKAGFGLFFIKNLFIIPDYFSDKEYNITCKVKLVGIFLITIIYFISGIDILPEFVFGGIGLIDDILILMWSIGLINEELDNYKKEFNKNTKSKIIEDVEWKIHDDKD